MVAGCPAVGDLADQFVTPIPSTELFSSSGRSREQGHVIEGFGTNVFIDVPCICFPVFCFGFKFCHLALVFSHFFVLLKVQFPRTDRKSVPVNILSVNSTE